MTKREMHIGVSLHGVGTTSWNWLHDDVRPDASVSLDHYRQLAAQAEAAKLDFLFIIDSTYITPESAPHFLNRLEPLTALSALATATTHLGLVATVTTSFTEPYTVARQFASLDLISDGRAGWNLVTTGLEGAAANYGRGEGHRGHTDRYGLAEEHLGIVRGLWDSWEDDAFIHDRAARRFFDPGKLHRLDHKGEHFSVAGPLNIARSRQGQPPIFQASGSETGRDLAARSTDVLFNLAEGFEEARDFYSDVKARAKAAGRDPASLLIMPSVRPIVGDTDEEAHHIARELNAQAPLAQLLVELGRPFSYHDFGQYDPDAPFPDLGTLGDDSYQSVTRRIKEAARRDRLSLREVALRFAAGFGQIVGSPHTIADELQRWFEQGAADGFILNLRNDTSFAAFADKVVPVLQARGLFRRDYVADTLRGHLGLAPTPNRHALARAATVNQRLAALQDQRNRDWEPALLQMNANQRRTLVEGFNPAQAIGVGDALGPVELLDVEGGTIALEELLAYGPVVLLFMRFAGCPACNLAVPAYDRELAALRESGVPIIAISPQVPERLVEIKRRHGLKLTVASDPGNRLARRLGLTYLFDEPTRKATQGPNWIGAVTGTETWELPLTSALVIGSNGHVASIDVTPDWMVRTEAKAIVEAVHAAHLAQPREAVPSDPA